MTTFRKCYDIINLGDIVYDYNDIPLGKCFFKSKDDKDHICLENGKFIIWINGFCFKNKKGWMFCEGDKKIFYKDCCA